MNANLSKIALALSAALLLLMPATAKATPGYARQAGLACEACHTVFPELTPFGRQFKLNAYTFSNVKQLQDINEKRESTLALSELAPLSIQVQGSFTSLGHALPDQGAPAVVDLSQKNDTEFPQALSLFYTGKIADNFGAFLQLTWAPNANSVGIDNSELRFADHAAIPAFGMSDFIYGVTLNNNPSVQDVWNSTPAWGFPFIASNVTVPTISKTLIDGGFAQQSAGLGGYIWAWNHLYVEATAYRSAQTGFQNKFTGNGPGPLDSTAGNPRISGFAPYWRLAWEQDWDRNALTVGTYGLSADTHPTGTGEHGPTDSFFDTALDLQYQYIGDVNIFSVLATWIHEKRHLDATAAANPSSHLDTARITGSYFYNRKIGGSLEVFSTTGKSDSVLFAATPVLGSNNGSPITQGGTVELDYLPWLNTKLGVQYTAYSRFNGASTNYDGAGRNAADNNTLFIFVWAAF